MEPKKVGCFWKKDPSKFLILGSADFCLLHRMLYVAEKEGPLARVLPVPLRM